MPPARTVLLTGITGFIAKRIAADLLRAGHEVVGTLRNPARAQEVRQALALAPGDPAEARLRFVELDLTRDAGWEAALAGCDALVHTASPFPMAPPRSDDEVVRPAVDGTRRALEAAQAAGVGRVVLTSSMVAVMHSGAAGPRRSEADWTDPALAATTAYDRSKTLAERAAWDFARAHPGIRLTTVNPGLVVGRPMDRHYGTSLAVIERFLSGRDPMVPDFGLPVVDIGDVSALHLLALARPETAGHRLLAAERWMTAPEIARLLADAFPDRRIATRVAPKPLLRLLALFDPAIRGILPTIGRKLEIDASATRALTGIDFRPAPEAILDSARFLLQRDSA